MRKATAPVPFSLEEPVSFHIPRVLVPISSPVVPVLFHPALLGVTLVIPVVRVIFDFLALPFPFSDTPALLLAAISLALYPGVGKKKPAAIGVGTSDLLAHGPPSRRKP
jgi:hypothetical protein